jgi:hypothetical protein
MAQTKAQKEALKKAEALLAKQRTRLASLESDLETLNPTPTSVNTTTLQGIQAASARPTEQQIADDTYYTKRLASGDTQAQLDARRNAWDVVNSINQTSPTNVASLDRTTGKVTTSVSPEKMAKLETSAEEKKYTVVNGVLLYNGQPFTGMYNGTKYVNGKPASTTEDDDDDTPVAITLVSTETDEYGNVIGVYSDGSTKILIPSGKKYKTTVDEDAYSILESTFKDFGLEELVPEIKKFMEAGLGSNQAAVELRKTTAYTTRFKGNEVRRATGLNVLSEAEYLALEDSYSETLRAYGLQNYFGIDRKVKTASMADIIGNDISAIEFKDRIDTVVTRVNNADPKIKNTLNAFYNITDTDLVKYFLNPKENLPKLQEKVTAAEIGTAALSQGLITDVNRATALAQMGITKEKAQEGYEAISGALPTTTKLSQIYGEEGINYTQATAEEEVFKQLESAKRKRLKLAEKEVGSFSGAAGLGRNALGTGKSSAF